MPTQAEMRSRNRRLRAELDDRQLARAADALCARLIELDTYRAATRIAAYFAVNGEIGLTPLIDHALAQGKQVYLPNLDRQALRFAPYFHAQKMRLNKYRLPEPDVADDDMLGPGELDLVLAPLVVFDAQRNRIGMGGGYYDRYLADHPRAVAVALAFEAQLTDTLPVEPHDRPMDLVVSEQRVLRLD